MKMSIIVSVYNVEKYIEDCIESIITLENKDIEIICVNDASTDGSGGILHYYEKIDARIQVVDNDTNKGLSTVRNIGLKLAKGEYIWFVDGDDRVTNPFAVDRLYEQAKKDDLDMLSFGMLYEYETRELEKKYKTFSKKLMSYHEPYVMYGDHFFSERIENGKFNCCVPVYIYKRKWLIDNSIWFENIYFEDSLFVPQALLSANRVSWTNEAYYLYYRREDSITTIDMGKTKKVECIMVVVDELME